MDASSPANQTSVAAQRQLQTQAALLPQQDQKLDMFSLRGFALAQRVAQAFATSDAVPAQYRSFVEKKGRDGSTWIENPAAMGNCLVAIEVAQQVGMSITAVMQNANVIEGQLRWSGKFKIAAINASGRFTPLRFDVKDKGPIKATYKEKLGWNDQKRKFDYADREVTVQNLECIAWALPAQVPIPHNVRTLDQAKAANLPVIESPPVNMKMVVEEGWYAKPGSKWQTEMKHLMLVYRAGSFFGDVHAPDVVMGMGRTADEMVDIIDVPATTVPEPTAAPAPAAAATSTGADSPEYVAQKNTTGTDEEHPPAGDGGQPQPMAFAEVAEAIVKAGTEIELQAARDLIPRVEDAEQQAELNAKAAEREKELAKPAPTAKPASRRAGAAARNVE